MGTRKMRCLSIILSGIIALSPATGNTALLNSDAVDLGEKALYTADRISGAEEEDPDFTTSTITLNALNEDGSRSEQTFILQYYKYSDHIEINGGFNGSVNASAPVNRDVQYISIPSSIEDLPVTVYKGDGSTSGFSNVVSVVLPDTLTKIGDRAFSGCTKLESIVIPDNVTEIGYSAFEKCSSLKSINIPDSVTSIGAGAFINCSSLESVTVPEGVTSVGRAAFSGCSALKNVSFPSATTKIENGLFSNCTSLKSFSIHENVTSIGEDAFSGSAVESINIPRNVKTIGYNAFAGCDNLEEVTMWNDTGFEAYSREYNAPFYESNVYTVRFYGTEKQAEERELQKVFPSAEIICLAEESDGFVFIEAENGIEIMSADETENGVYIVPGEIGGKTVTEISSGTFSKDPIVYFEGSSSQWAGFSAASELADSGSVFCGYSGTHTSGDYDYESFENGVILIGYKGSGASVNIPSELDGKPVIGLKETFKNNRELTEAVIPASITHILGESPFNGASSLENILVDSKNTAFRSADGVLYSRDMSKLISYPARHSSEKTLIIPDSVRSVIDYCLYGTSFDNVYFPASVEEFGEYLFGETNTKLFFEADRKHINELYPHSAKSFYLVKKDGDFLYTSEIYVQKGDEYTVNGETVVADSYEYVQEDKYALCKYIGSSSEVVIPSESDGLPVDAISEEAFKALDDIVSVTIPGSIRRIGASAFYKCSSLKSVKLSSGLTKIGDSAFSNCSALSEVKLPDSLETIGSSAFSMCQKLRSVVIPEGVTSIGGSAFGSCNALTSVQLPSTLTEIGSYAFCYDSNITSFTISDKNPAYSADSHWLYNKDKTTVYLPFGKQEPITVIPDSVTTIEDAALSSLELYNGSGKALFIPASVTEIKGYLAPAYNIYKEADGYKYSDNMIYKLNEDGAASIVFLSSGETSLTLPAAVGDDKKVTSLGYSAIDGARSISSITIPEGVTEIETKKILDGKNGPWDERAYYVLLVKPKVGGGVVSGDTEQTPLMSCAAAKQYLSDHPELELFEKDVYTLKSMFAGHSFSSISLPSTLGEIEEGCISSAYNVGKLTINNPDCIINDTAINCDIYGHTGSTAESFALEHGLVFHSLDGEDRSEKTSGRYTYTNTGSGIRITRYTPTEGDPIDLTVPAEIDGKPVLSIGEGAFEDANARSITFSEGINRIERFAFGYFYGDASFATDYEKKKAAVLEELHFPASLKKIENSVNTYGLKVIEVSPDNTSYTAVDNVLYDKHATKLITYPNSKTDTEYTVPDTVNTGIGELYNRFLKTVNISQNIDRYDMMSFGRGLPELEAVTVDPANEQLYSEDGVLYQRSLDRAPGYSTGDPAYETLLLYPPKKAGSEFTAPDGVVSLSNQAFNNTEYLKKLILPSTLKDIYSDFEDSSITEFEIAGGNEGLTSVDGILYSKDKKTIVKYPSGRTDKEFVVSDGITEIADNAFGHSSFEKIVLPDGLTRIGSFAFSYSGLREITIPDSVKCIGRQAFSGLENMEFEGNIWKVDKWIVGSSSNYRRKYVTDETDNIIYDGNGRALHDGNVYYVEFDEASQELIWHKVDDVSLHIPDGTVGIASDSFRDNLENSLYIPRSVKYICDCAFQENEELIDIYYEGSKEEWEAILIDPQAYYGDDDHFSAATVHYGEEMPPEATTTTTASATTSETTTTSTSSSATTSETETSTTGSSTASETTTPTSSSATTSETVTTTTASETETPATTTSVILGDANDDGNVDLKDVVSMRRALAGGWGETVNETNSDVNGDGSFDLKDIVHLRRYLAGGWGVKLVKREE